VIETSPDYANRIEMPVPVRWRDIFWQPVLYTVVIMSVAISVWNISRLTMTPILSLITSAIWLSFVVALLTGAIAASGGVRQFMIEQLGAFSRKQFAAIERQQSGPPLICFGYRRFGRHFYFLKVRIDAIEALDWHLGQASSISGKDENDWSVVLWFDRSRLRSVSNPYLRRLHYRVYTVGPYGTKQQIESFALSLLEFLRRAGAKLAQGEDRRRRKFVRPRRESNEG